MDLWSYDCTAPYLPTCRMDDSLENNTDIKLRHVAACTNKSPSCVSSERNGLFLFGSCNSVAVCKSEVKADGTGYQSIKKTLNKHTGRVNCVRFIRGMTSDSCMYFVTGSTDCNVICWKCESESADLNFSVCKVLKGHTGAVTAIDGIILTREGNLLVASTGVDSSLIVWRGALSSLEKDLELQHKIDFSGMLVLTVSLQLLMDDVPILACGLDNGNVQLYCISYHGDATDLQNVKNHEFELALTLHGHEDWVRGTDFLSVNNNDSETILATCSQDTFIRLWRISLRESEENVDEGDTLKVKENAFRVITANSQYTYTVRLESVLSGHEGWVYSVHWAPNSENFTTARLVSASMDKSVIIWGMDAESDLWIEKVRFGEVGGNTLGFYGAKFNSTGSEIIAHSYNGALHLWEEEKNKCGDGLRWRPGVMVSGHFGPVLDIAWEPTYGRFLLTTSMDQSSRLIAPWKINGNESWHEIARPQIHGYDMQCLTMTDSFHFVSGADEKVIRVFEAPRNFLQNLKSISGATLEKDSCAPEGASVPALGLSNKAVFSTISDGDDAPKSKGEQYIENQFTSVALNRPPTEEHLLQNTLWPETHKLYSHVYEIFCIAANSAGTLVASAAKSATSEHAAIVLWDTKTWKEIERLSGHALTVTQMEFSHDDQFLLSVSRDRTWILHRITESESKYSVSMFAKSVKQTGHARIIWSCSWTHDDNVFSTSSRDKKIMFWKLNDSSSEPSATTGVSRVCVIDASEPVTAVSFAPDFVKPETYLFCAGKESGILELHIFSVFNAFYSCSLLHKFDSNQSHGLTVKRLQWKPKNNNENAQDFWLASCGLDHAVKIFSINIL